MTATRLVIVGSCSGSPGSSARGQLQSSAVDLTVLAAIATHPDNAFLGALPGGVALVTQAGDAD